VFDHCFTIALPQLVPGVIMVPLDQGVHDLLEGLHGGLGMPGVQDDGALGMKFLEERHILSATGVHLDDESVQLILLSGLHFECQPVAVSDDFLLVLLSHFERHAMPLVPPR